MNIFNMKYMPEYIIAVIIIVIFAVSVNNKIRVDASTIDKNVVGVLPAKFEATVHKFEALRTYPTNLPENVQAKETLIYNYLIFKGVSDSDIVKYMNIIRKESHYNETIEPLTDVKYCVGGDITELGQCSRGVLYTEKSYGLAQILPTTAKEAGCADYKKNWTTQLDCMLKVKSYQGYEAWSTYDDNLFK